MTLISFEQSGYSKPDPKKTKENEAPKTKGHWSPVTPNRGPWRPIKHAKYTSKLRKER